MTAFVDLGGLVASLSSPTVFVALQVSACRAFSQVQQAKTAISKVALSATGNS
jgi:hypothetical protein